jgi:hypothetical protein
MTRPPVRWTLAQARKVLAEQEASGITLAEFARQRQIPPKRLYRWRDRLRQHTEPAPLAPRLVELLPPAPTSPAPSRTPLRIHIHCPSGHTIELIDGDPADALQQALDAIARVHPC